MFGSRKHRPQGPDKSANGPISRPQDTPLDPSPPASTLTEAEREALLEKVLASAEASEELTQEQKTLFREQLGKAATRNSLIASSASILVTAASYALVAGDAAKLSLMQTLAVVAPSMATWVTLYFGKMHFSKRRFKKEDPAFAKFIPKKQLWTNLKIYCTAEVAWFASRFLLDKGLIFGLSKLSGVGDAANTAGAVGSHAILAFVVFPKWVMPVMHRMFDERKNKKKT